MADTHRLIRQWLETDAAFGVSDVPLPHHAHPTLAPAPTPIAAAKKPALPPTPPAPAAQPQPRRPAQLRTQDSGLSTPDTLLPTLSKSAPATKKKAALPPIPAGNIADLPPITRRQKESALAALQQEVEAASKPFLNDISTRPVFGEGDPDADILFVGEGPGIEEDRSGRPFVGRSGQLLDKMIAAIGYTRTPGLTGTGGAGGVFIANVVKLRAAELDPTTNRLTDRPPNPEEVARGLPFLHRQIEIIRPKVIVTLGAPAVKYLTGTTEGVMKLRGSWLAYRGIPVMPTYHPAFVLRAYTVENRKKVWDDLKLAQQKAKGG